MNRLHKRAKIADRTATGVLYAVAGFFLLLLAAFTIYILYRGCVSFKPEYLSFTREGIGVQFFNTIYLVFLSLLISVPIGVAAGIYMAEYAGNGQADPAFCAPALKRSPRCLPLSSACSATLFFSS